MKRLRSERKRRHRGGPFCDDEGMEVMNNIPAQKIAIQTSMRDRIAGIDKKLAESKQALREWVREQNQNLDLEEEELRNKDEAIDMSPLEESAPMLVGVSGDAKLAELMAQADALMSKSSAETREKDFPQ